MSKQKQISTYVHLFRIRRRSSEQRKFIPILLRLKKKLKCTHTTLHPMNPILCQWLVWQNINPFISSLRYKQWIEHLETLGLTDELNAVVQDWRDAPPEEKVKISEAPENNRPRRFRTNKAVEE